MMVSVHFQVERVWNHLGDKSPGTRVKDYLVSGLAYGRWGYMVNWAGKAYLNVGGITPWAEILDCIQRREQVKHSIHLLFACWLCMPRAQMLQAPEKKESTDKTWTNIEVCVLSFIQ